MRVGLIDVDSHKFPNLALMKLSAYHKLMGDSVEWYTPFGERYDVVFMSKVFSFTPDYDLCINSDLVVQGGTGYCITLENGKEVFDKGCDFLPQHIEHIYPDYSLYNITDTAYGFLSRGCPRACERMPSEHLPGYTERQEEAADIIISILGYLFLEDVDIDKLIEDKMRFNEARED